MLLGLRVAFGPPARWEIPMADARGFENNLYLISHLCHDLVSPIGAINNGVELIEEGGGAMDRDALALIAQSAQVAAAKLRCYRLAYGAAGRSRQFRPRDARQALKELFATDGKLELDWPADPQRDHDPVGVQLLLNAALLVAQMLPRGGRLAVRFYENASEVTRVNLLAEGVVKVPESVEAVMTGRSDRTDHRTAHARFCCELAEIVQGNGPAAIQFVAQPQAVTLSLVMPVSLDDG